MKLLNLEDVKVVEDVEKCKGLFWRASVSSFLSSHRSIETRKSLRLLKRKSCTGCDQCEWIWDYIHEMICDSWGRDNDYLGEIEHGKIYTYKVNSSQGYFDQYPEIDDIEFVEVKE